MREKIDKGTPWVALLVSVGLVFGTLVWAAFGRNHTKTVTVTKTHTVTVVRRVTPPWDGTAQGLANYVRATAGGMRPCPKNFRRGLACYDIVGGTKFYVFLAVPSSS